MSPLVQQRVSYATLPGGTIIAADLPGLPYRGEVGLFTPDTPAAPDKSLTMVWKINIIFGNENIILLGDERYSPMSGGSGGMGVRLRQGFNSRRATLFTAQAPSRIRPALRPWVCSKARLASLSKMPYPPSL